MDLLEKENWNLVEKCKFLAIECEIEVITSSHKIFQFFENLTHLPFFIEFKIGNVGRMHSYECDGNFKRGVPFGFGMKEK